MDFHSHTICSAILETLSSKFALNAKQIGHEVDKILVKHVTHQAIYKTLLSLMAGGYVVKKKGIYSLSEDYLQYLISYSPRVHSNLIQFYSNPQSGENEPLDIFKSLSKLIEQPMVTRYFGKEGVMEIYDDMVRTGKPIYTWTDIQFILDNIGDYMYEYIRNRVKGNITVYSFMPPDKLNEDFSKRGEKRIVKFLQNLNMPGEIRIFGDKVAVIGDKNGTVLRGKIFTDLIRESFSRLWKNVPK